MKIWMPTFGYFSYENMHGLLLEESEEKSDLGYWHNVFVCRVTLFQSLLLKGIQLTSPTLATAMPNLAPGLIFAIAWIFRYTESYFSVMETL